MKNFKEFKEKAILFRKEGFSYSEILKRVPVAKSTLSDWLRLVGLSKRQKQRLTEKKLAAMKRGWEKMHQLRMERWKEIKNKAENEIKNLSKKERFILGVALYWAEGAKEKEYGSATNIKFSNSDAKMILVFRKWLNEFFVISKENIKYELYIHEKADLVSAKKFWALNLNISPEDIRVYFKPHNIKPKRKNIGRDYHGLIRIAVLDSINLVRKINGWVDGICKNCGVV